MTTALITKELLEPAIRRVHQDDTLIVKEIKLSKPDLAGAQFSSRVETAEIIVSSERSKTEKVINIFIKLQAQSDAHKNQLEHMDIFEKESVAYNDIIPELINYSKSKGVNLEDIIPVSYYASHNAGERMIILEDISIQGYKMHPYCSTTLQDIDHVTLVLTAIAKLHAVSYCMKKNIDFPKKYPSLKNDFFKNSPESFLFTIMKPLFQAPMNLFEPSSKIRKDMEKFHDRGFEHLVKVAERKEPFNVINHGDFWNNNMLFKYDDNGKPTHVKFVDFQGVHYTSLALDLTSFLCASTTAEFRKNHLQAMLKLYYNEFTDAVGRLGAKMEFTFDEFREEFKSKGLIGYMMIPGMFTAGLQTKGDHSNPDDVKGADLSSGFTGVMTKLMANPEKKEIMQKILTDIHKEFEELLDDLK